MKTVTYIFAKGRKENFLSNNIQAEEFYYGLTKFNKNEFEIRIIELDENSNLMKIPLVFIDKIFNKFLNLPMNLSKILSFKNLKVLYSSDYLFLVNETIGLSVLPILIIIKMIKKVNVSLFVMGLYSKEKKYKSLTGIHNAIIKLLVFFMDNVFILGKGEYEISKSIHSKTNKLIFAPFCIDETFWVQDNNFYPSKNNQIIFVGNDGNRDYEMIASIAKELRNINFVFVTSNKKLNKLNLKNLKVINGHWNSLKFSDNDLLNEYKKSRLTILPIKDTSQPSGQSVALQSMALGVPVLINKTKGFWDYSKFDQNENIFFVENNTLESWVNAILNLYNKKNLIDSVGKNSSKLVHNEYNSEIFFDKLKKYVLTE